ncbi:helix-turn-helix domain-containing protein [Acetobacter thailandicus]|uniref:helix-turn-helix domain-containing protein n=1 Tax=Acetobacter thailandicus TaxID=1502842 RepID=UPI001BAB80D0|nr:helix-turn-helix domain-containing protein [Acetobacter thailandicus]MBS0986867.1 Hin recombinase [Acetobacter thailandicus]
MKKSARSKGKVPGRRPKLSPEQVTELRKRAISHEPKAQIARDFKISRETLYSYLKTS